MAKKKEEITSTDYKAQIIDMILNTENIVKLQVLETFIENCLETKPKIKVNEDDRQRVWIMILLSKIKNRKSLDKINSCVQRYWLDYEDFSDER